MAHFFLIARNHLPVEGSKDRWFARRSAPGAATTSFKVIRKHSRPFLGVHFDGTSEDVQIERLNLLTREFQLDTRHKQGYNIAPWHQVVRRNVQSAFGP